MMRKGELLIVLMTMGAGCGSDAPVGNQGGSLNGDDSADEAEDWADQAVDDSDEGDGPVLPGRKDAGVWRDAGPVQPTPKDAGISRDAGRRPEYCEPATLVQACMTPERFDNVLFDACNAGFTSGSIVHAEARECPFGTDKAWVTCCYGPSEMEPEFCDPGQPKDAGAVFPSEPECSGVGIASHSCRTIAELEYELRKPCEEQGMQLEDVNYANYGGCAWDYATDISGSCCPVRMELPTGVLR